MSKIVYTYKMRPGYGSPNFLIEFDIYPDMEQFVNELLDLLAHNGYKYQKTVDLWMNDEVMMILSSSNGNVHLSRDIWDMVFIMGDDNQTDIHNINKILQSDGRFKNEPYDVEEYRL